MSKLYKPNLLPCIYAQVLEMLNIKKNQVISSNFNFFLKMLNKTVGSVSIV